MRKLLIIAYVISILWILTATGTGIKILSNESFQEPNATTKMIGAYLGIVFGIMAPIGLVFAYDIHQRKRTPH